MKTLAGVSLFIIEDDDHFRETFMDAMALRGIQVEGARSGLLALQSLADKSPSAIIIDVKLPDIHGFELCRMLKKSERLRSIPVIFVSASMLYNDPRDRAEGFLAGAAAFLPKPIKLEKLWDEIEILLR